MVLKQKLLLLGAVCVCRVLHNEHTSNDKIMCTEGPVVLMRATRKVLTSEIVVQLE